LCQQHGPIWPELERHLVSGQHVADMSATFPTKIIRKVSSSAFYLCHKNMVILM
jgi:hypothetical protein